MFNLFKLHNQYIFMVKLNEVQQISQFCIDKASHKYHRVENHNIFMSYNEHFHNQIYFHINSCNCQAVTHMTCMGKCFNNIIS